MYDEEMKFGAERGGRNICVEAYLYDIIFIPVI